MPKPHTCSTLVAAHPRGPVPSRLGWLRCQPAEPHNRQYGAREHYDADLADPHADRVPHLLAQTLESSGRLERVSGGSAHRPSVDPLALTAREDDVTSFVLLGHMNNTIAAWLFLTTKTVEWHPRNAYAKLGVTSGYQLRRVRSVSYTATGAQLAVTARHLAAPAFS